MVTAKTQYSLRNAESYFAEHLCVGDYYEEGQRVAGEWFGQAANRLGLSGKVLATDFQALCEKQIPSTQETLTVRLKTTRTEDGQTTANRRIFYDFTFSPPKSVSLVALLAGDSRIEAAHLRAVHSALGEFEAFAATRIRRGGTRSHRTTGNLAAALFSHDTSRALDPHLHTHCIVFNATFDPVEKRWKALENHELLKSRRFVENAYYHELARKLRRFGYEIRNRARGDFEIEGVADDLCARFSKRHAQIDQSLAAILQNRPELVGSNLKDLRERLAEAERARKQQTLSRPDLQTLWKGQITAFEREQLRKLTISPDSSRPRNVMTLTEGVRWAEDHLFDRNSVVPECQVWQEALGRIRGEEFSIAELKETTRRRGYILDATHPGDVTLQDVLLREWEIIRIAKDGVGEVPALVEAPRMSHSELDEEQRNALDRLLRSTNTVTLFRGGAGTGKSFVLRRLVEEVRQTDRAVVVLAPQRQQVVEMEQSGFQSPKTVASFLQRKELPQGALVVVDEAGQIGGRQMLDLLRLVRQSNARVLLSGDSRQHGPVEASDALVAIEKHSGLRPVELHSIRRQDPALGRDEIERQQIREYRKAVEAAANGKLADSFTKLDAAGSVISCGLDNQADKLSEEYLRIREQSASAVVVSQTWAEVNRVNSSIRDALKSKGLLGHPDTLVESLDKLDLTNAQKRDERFYPPEAIIVFNQKVRDAEPGKPGKLAGIVSSGGLFRGNIVVRQPVRPRQRRKPADPRSRPVIEAGNVPWATGRGTSLIRRLSTPSRVASKSEPSASSQSAVTVSGTAYFYAVRGGYARIPLTQPPLHHSVFPATPDAKNWCSGLSSSIGEDRRWLKTDPRLVPERGECLADAGEKAVGDIRGGKAVNANTPERSSAAAFPRYLTGEVVADSVALHWPGLYARRWRLPQVVDRFLVPATSEPHISCNLRGLAEFRERDMGGAWITRQIRSGDLFVTRSRTPYEVHFQSPPGQELDNLSIHIAVEPFLAALEARYPGKADRVEVLDFFGRDEILWPICLTCAELLNARVPGKSPRVAALTQLMAAHIVEKYTTAGKTPAHRGGLPIRQLRKVEDFVAEHVAEEISIEQLAELVELSASHFAHVFKETAGMTPLQFVTRQRITLAQQLIRETSRSLIDVGLEVGYSSPSHFAQVFRRVVGVTPTEFRSSL